VGLVVDTGVVLASIEPRDKHHLACSHLLETTREERIVPSVVLVEVEYLLSRTRQVDVFVSFLDDCARGAFVIEELQQADYVRIGELLTTYADLRVGFVDAAVLAIVERLREPKLATLDHRHFSVMRPRHIEALELLPA
jgi:predicted nucleic acid-binding protein